MTLFYLLLASGTCQGWGKYIDSVLGYKYKYIKNVQVQVQVQVQGFAKCTWVLPNYIVNVLGYNYQVLSTNVSITHTNIPVNA